MEYQFFQGAGVLDGEAIGIVVEIDEYSLLLFSPLLDFPFPLVQFFVRVIGAI